LAQKARTVRAFIAVETIVMHALGYEAWGRTMSICLPAAAPARLCRAIVSPRRCDIVDKAGHLCQSRTLDFCATRADAEAAYAKEAPRGADVAWTLVRLLEVSASSEAQACRSIFYGFPGVHVLARTPDHERQAQARAYAAGLGEPGPGCALGL
jgi:hypothetical protein